MLQVPLTEIPRERSLVLDVAPSAEELKALLADAAPFALAAEHAFEARVRLQRIDDAVRVAGQVAVEVVFECGRCLEERAVRVEAELEYLLISRAQWELSHRGHASESDDDDGVELSAHELDMHYYEGEFVELGSLLREALLLELPPHGICPEELEAECDAAFQANITAQSSGSGTLGDGDPRWAALRELKKKRETN